MLGFATDIALILFFYAYLLSIYNQITLVGLTTYSICKSCYNLPAHQENQSMFLTLIELISLGVRLFIA